SFNGKLRDELLNIEIFYSLKEAQVLIGAWRRHYNAVRPHGSLRWKPLAPEAIVILAWSVRPIVFVEMEASMH
ncbi:MAG TPA: transposase, partial [Hyphomonadaceae bacterium]|nr:transposase [Hyphomonadaceae bacterium]